VAAGRAHGGVGPRGGAHVVEARTNPGWRGHGDRRGDERARRAARDHRPRGLAGAGPGSRDRPGGAARERRSGSREHGHHRRGSVARRGAPAALPADRSTRGPTLGATVTAALRLDGVSFSYGAVQVLADVSLALAPGERVALLGRNGAGKSTLARLVPGLARPGAGTVWVGDWDTRDHSPVVLARRVGSVFQHADQQLFARTLEDDVAFGPRALGFERSDVAGRVARALDALELGAQAREHPYDLPPALRKLAALAGALALEPALLVLDEPTAGLDRALRARVTRALLERAGRAGAGGGGAALLVITHDLTFAAELLDRALVLDRGRLACDESLAGLLGAAARLETLGLLRPPVAELSTAL